MLVLMKVKLKKCEYCRVWKSFIHFLELVIYTIAYEVKGPDGERLYNLYLAPQCHNAGNFVQSYPENGVRVTCPVGIDINNPLGFVPETDDKSVEARALMGD